MYKFRKIFYTFFTFISYTEYRGAASTDTLTRGLTPAPPWSLVGRVAESNKGINNGAFE